MAKFNVKVKVGDYSKREDATVNHEGGLAFKLSPEMELYIRSASCLSGEKKFYDVDKNGDNEILKLVGEVSKTNPEFPLQLAAHCRNDLYLRSVPVALLVESCKHDSKKYVRRYTPSIINRADELTEAVAFYKQRNGDIGDATKKGMLCNPLKRGLADSFHKFNEYQLAKYDRDGGVKLKDVMKIVHPKPKNPKEAALFKRVVERSLVTPETWEVSLSTKGASKKTWEEILPKMSIMAVIRNLRNLLENDVDIKPVVKMLTDPKIIAKSKQFPFRFYSAYKQVNKLDKKNTGKILDALNTAVELSVDNIPKLKGTTFVAVDLSGSMSHGLSDLSTMTLKEVGSLFGAMIHKKCKDSVVSVYGSEFKVVNLSTKNLVLTNMEIIVNTNVGGSTNAWMSIRWLNKTKTIVDRIVLLTDEESYDSYGDHSVKGELDIYRKTVNPDVYVYVINLAGYGTSEFPEGDKNVCLMGGWSDKVVEFIPAYEERETILGKIKKITPDTYKKVMKEKVEE